jgi:hypothetical protein
MYIEIDGTKYPCEVKTGITQLGNTVIRVTSETAPVATNGFVLYTDDESMEFDRSDYKFLYREDGNVKEYTTEPEEIIPAQGYTTGVPENPIAKALSNLNNRITEITPYEQSKTAYYGENEKVFYGVPNGILTVNMDGEYTVERIEDRVYVRFERLDETKDITITVE